jgi:hypothetical protein
MLLSDGLNRDVGELADLIADLAERLFAQFIGNRPDRTECELLARTAIADATAFQLALVEEMPRLVKHITERYEALGLDAGVPR